MENEPCGCSSNKTRITHECQLHQNIRKNFTNQISQLKSHVYRGECDNNCSWYKASQEALSETLVQLKASNDVVEAAQADPSPAPHWSTGLTGVDTEWFRTLTKALEVRATLAALAALEPPQ